MPDPAVAAFDVASLPLPLTCALAFLFGACIGSFLNVVALRLPHGRDLWTTRSRCPSCQGVIPWYGLIPIVGYAILRARCARCGMQISLRYPTVEIVSGLLTLATLAAFHLAEPTGSLLSVIPTPPARFSRDHLATLVPLASSLWLLYTGIVLALIDLDHRILPDAITLPGTLISFLFGSLNPAIGWKMSLAGAALAAGGLYAISWIYLKIRGREGMGLGDVKYLGMLGAALGPKGVLLCLMLASVSGALIGSVVGFARREGLSVAIPFGPFLAFGGWAVSVWGPQITQFLYPPV